MASILGPYSPLTRFLSKVADLMLLNLLFVATSLPLITVGASTTALHDTAIKLVTDRYESVTTAYLTSFRRNFRQGTLLGAALVGLAAVLTGWYVVAINLRLTTPVRVVLLALVFLAAYRLAATALFAFCYLATFEDSVATVLNNARRLSARHPMTSVTVLALPALSVVVTIFYPAVLGWGLGWLAIGFAGLAFLTAIVMVDVLRPYGLPA